MKAVFDTRQLLAFNTLARNGSFTQTARELRVSQSGVSHAIRTLERKIGCRLFERDSRHVTLTLAGEHFLHHVGRIADEMSAAQAALQSLRNWGQIQLRIAAPASVCEVLVPHCLRELAVKYPHSLTRLVAADRTKSVKELLAGRVDLAIAVGIEPDERFEYQPLFSDELVFVVPPHHPWATQPPQSPAAIGSERLLAYPRHSYTWHVIQDHFAVDGILPTIVVESDSVTAIRQMAKLGLGVGILARWVVADEVAQGTLCCLPVGPRPLTRHWGALYLRTRRMSLPQTTFIEQVKRAGLGLLAEVQSPPTVPRREVRPLTHAKNGHAD